MLYNITITVEDEHNVFTEETEQGWFDTDLEVAAYYGSEASEVTITEGLIIIKPICKDGVHTTVKVIGE